MRVEIGPYEENRKIDIEYHDYDTWNLDNTLALIILPGLKQLKETNHGYSHVNSKTLATISISLPDNIVEDSEEAWEWAQNEMIWAFEQIIKDDLPFNEEIYNKVNKGLLLFGLYFRSLWD